MLYFNKKFVLLDKFYKRSAAFDIISNEQILIRNSNIDKAEQRVIFSDNLYYRHPVPNVAELQ